MGIPLLSELRCVLQLTHRTDQVPTSLSKALSRHPFRLLAAGASHRNDPHYDADDAFLAAAEWHVAQAPVPTLHPADLLRIPFLSRVKRLGADDVHLFARQQLPPYIYA